MSKTLAEKIEVMQHFANGGKVEHFFRDSGIWLPCLNPVWDWLHNGYRIVQPPEDEIPWPSIDPKWRWAARDADGLIYLYDEKPTKSAESEQWIMATGEVVRASGCINVKNNGRDWIESLQKRPD